MLKKLLAFVVLIGVMGAVGAYYIITQLEKYSNQPINLSEPTLFVVESGTNFHRVINQLNENALFVESPFIRLFPKRYPDLIRIKAGTYQLTPDMNLRQALTHLGSGVEHQFTITFVEGSRFTEWLQQLENAEYVEQKLTDLSEEEIATKLGIERKKLEGLFLAETYHYSAGDSDVDILKRAHVNLNKALEAAWEIRDEKLPLKNQYEALTLASIIEKETAIDSERARVSSVFVNRLNKGMRLQTDPTVIYGMGDDYDGNIRKKDLRTPTPYNTYVINGLPPTPIAMVGEASIIASLNPEESNYFYFVASGKGGHVFSKTLSEHNRAVRAYLKELRKKK